MRLIQRGQHLFTIRSSGRTIWYFRASAAAGVLIAGTAGTTSHAEITLSFRDGNATAQGQLRGGVPSRPFTDLKQYDVTDPAPPGFASFMLEASPPPDKTTIDGASATSNGQVNLTITLDTVADTLVVSSDASASATVIATQTPTRQTTANALGFGVFNVQFSIDSLYDYEIISALSAGAQADPNRDAGAESFIVLLGGGTVYSRNRFFATPRNTDGSVGPDRGSSVGTLDAGGYSLAAQAVAGLNNRDGSSANADYQFTLQLSPASRWIEPDGGSFQGISNWSAAVPGFRDVAVFDLPGTYTVTLEQDVTNKRLRASGAGVNVSFDLKGFDYTLDEISVGGFEGDDVSITFDDSSDVVVSAASAAAGDGVPPGAAAANGGERRLRADLLKAGKGGSAKVTIPISTMFGQIASDGRVDVKGAKGRWDVEDLAVGIGGTGLLEVSGGGGLTSKRAVLGDGPPPGGSTIVKVTGRGSFWDNTLQLVVGKRHGALLLIEDKAIVSSAEVVIGAEEGSSGLIEVSNASLLKIPGGFLTGSITRGALEVRNGGLVECDSFFIGTGIESANGRMTVESLGQVRAAGSLFIGGRGTGRLTVNGGRVEQLFATGVTEIAQKGVVEVLRGHFHARNNLEVNGTLAINAALGSASVGKFSTELIGRLAIGPGGTLKGNGIIRGELEVFGGDDSQFGGRVLPGTSPGTLMIEGDYEQTGGLLGIEIAGTAPGQFDVLAVTGNATLGGTLLLEFIDDFAPRAGDVFEFLDVGGALSGAFEEVEVRNLARGFQFDVRSDGGGLTMVALNDGIFVPEPASTVLLILAAAIGTWRGRRLASRVPATR